MARSSYPRIANPSNKQKMSEAGLVKVNGKSLGLRRRLYWKTLPRIQFHLVNLGMEEWADICLESLERPFSASLAGEDDCFLA